MMMMQILNKSSFKNIELDDRRQIWILLGLDDQCRIWTSK